MLKKIAALTVCLMWSAITHATPITIGNLSSDDDGSTNVITDTLNMREWLRTDVIDELTYAQTIAATGSGGAYDGWQIANQDDAQIFVDALLGTNSCTTSQSAQTLCGSLSIGQDLIGLTDYSHFGGTTQSLAWFLSDNGVGAEVGNLYFDAFTSSVDRVLKYNEWGSINSSDAFSTVGGSDSAGWLIYRDTTPVPAPGSIFFFALSMAVVTLRRLNKAG